MTKEMELEDNILMIILNMKGIGFKIKQMDMDKLSIIMELHMKENFIMELIMEKGS